MKILGISAFYHDSAAAIIQNGKIIAAAQEERFTRKKHDAAFPRNSIQFCLEKAKITLDKIDYIAFYDKPLIKFERLLETYLSCAPRGLSSFIKAMPLWLKDKLFLKTVLAREFKSLMQSSILEVPPILFGEHHQSHAASAFFPSPFQSAAVMCLDGVGEWATSSIWHGKGAELIPLWEIQFPHSLGLLYSAFTYYTGFKVNSGEYKLMGLAPYGSPKYVNTIKENLIDIKDDGTFWLDMKYFGYHVGLTMTNRQFDKLFKGPPRKPESDVTQKEMDLARSIQVVTEEIVLKLANTAAKETGEKNLCLAGGVALNCVANGELKRRGIFEDIWIQPAAGDAGGALGAAMSCWYSYLGNARVVEKGDSMRGAYLGPSFSSGEAKKALSPFKPEYQEFEEDALLKHLCKLLAAENVIGWFQGAMEYGPRALGARSILGDPRSQKMQSTMNLKIKYRESFRPFAPAVLEEEVSNWFDYPGRSPYMLMVAQVHDNKKVAEVEDENLFGIDKLRLKRSSIPAITHVDYSARLQTVNNTTNPRFYRLLEKFHNETKCPVLINTSFNVRGEPIVCTPEDAYRCFMRTEMDYLVIENLLFTKTAQPQWNEKSKWQEEFTLD